MAYQKIVVGIDGSSCGEHARDLASALAAATSGTLTVAHASEDGPDEELVAQALQAAKAAGVSARGEHLEGSAADALAELAERRNAELLVLGMWGLGRSHRHAIGSVPHRISHHAPCDVLIAAEHEHAGDAEIWGRIVIATDGSPTADRACRRGFELAAQLGADVVLVFVGHPKTGELILDDTVATIDSEIPTRKVIMRGEPAALILETAEEEDARLIIIGNRGMSGAKRFLLGSVPQKVIEATDRDVLVVRTVTQDLREIKKGEGGVVVDGGEKLAVYRDPEGEAHATSARCTHMGCTVGWNAAEKTWDCPCHGSRFAPTGEVVNGPAKKPLPKVALET